MDIIAREHENLIAVQNIAQRYGIHVVQLDPELNSVYFLQEGQDREKVYILVLEFVEG